MAQLIEDCERAFVRGHRAELESTSKRLYLSLSFFIAENLAHMYREETETTRLLWRLYSDDELRGIEGAIVASESPEQLAVGMPLDAAFAHAEGAGGPARRRAAGAATSGVSRPPGARGERAEPGRLPPATERARLKSSTN